MKSVQLRMVLAAQQRALVNRPRFLRKASEDAFMHTEAFHYHTRTGDLVQAANAHPLAADAHRRAAETHEREMHDVIGEGEMGFVYGEPYQLGYREHSAQHRQLQRLHEEAAK
jgi:hypothetical protein